MKSFVALFALSALVNAVPEPQLTYPVVYSGRYHGVIPTNYQPMTRYFNGAAVPVEPYANQKARLDHYKAKAEEYEKKGYKTLVPVHPIFKRDAEPEPFLPYGVNYVPAVYNHAPTVYTHNPVVYSQPAVYNPAVVTYKQEIDDVETPADTQKVSYTQKVVSASPFYSAFGYTFPVVQKEEEKRTMEKRDADSQFVYPTNFYGNYYNPNVAPFVNLYNAFNPLTYSNVIRPATYVTY